MSYPAAAIANDLLDRGRQSGTVLTNINIQKLVYFAHGWSLALMNTPLVAEPIEAWPYGPVVRRLYDSFKRFGSSKITEYATEWMPDAEGVVHPCQPRIVSNDASVDQRSIALVTGVWAKYGHLQPFKLVELTHLAGSPWDQARKTNSRYIANETMREYFKQLSATGSPA